MCPYTPKNLRPTKSKSKLITEELKDENKSSVLNSDYKSEQSKTSELKLINESKKRKLVELEGFKYEAPRRSSRRKV